MHRVAGEQRLRQPGAPRRLRWPCDLRLGGSGCEHAAELGDDPRGDVLARRDQLAGAPARLRKAAQEASDTALPTPTPTTNTRWRALAAFSISASACQISPSVISSTSAVSASDGSGKVQTTSTLVSRGLR
jgi:hypothetical protein